MLDGAYLHAQARRCFDLSQQCFDITVAEQLRVLSESFDAKARDMDAGATGPRRDSRRATIVRLVVRMRSLPRRFGWWPWRARAG